ncbi:radical SAM protein, partial [Desulfovibrio oxamicus]
MSALIFPVPEACCGGRGPGHARGAACASAAPPRIRPRILPIFLPFAGCPTRCVFCAQDVQTGQHGGVHSLARTLAQAEARLEHEARLLEAAAASGDRQPRDHPAPATGRGAPARYASPSPLEIAFYGGTFTLLPEAERAECLKLAARWRQRGVVCRVRCSTRPDAVTARGLATLRAAGMDCVELGVQSFDDA